MYIKYELNRAKNENIPIENKMISKSVESAQRKVEGKHFSIRKHVLQYDDVMNTSQALTIAIQMEKDAIETYKAFELATRDSDPVSNQKIREILADEEEHLEALNSFSLDMLATK